MNQDFIKEKKAIIQILESSRKECAEVLVIASLLIYKSKLLKRATEEMKAEEKVDGLKIVRDERIVSLKNLNLQSTQWSGRKKTKKYLVEN